MVVELWTVKCSILDAWPLELDNVFFFSATENRITLVSGGGPYIDPGSYRHAYICCMIDSTSWRWKLLN